MNNFSSAIEAAILGGLAILEVYENEFEVFEKSDTSPLTQADLNAHNAILTILSKTNIPVLSEEGKDISFQERNSWSQFWMVDPLDGTKEFIKRNGEFTVNIALIENGQPIFGVIYVPVERTLYVGELGEGAIKYNEVNKFSDVALNKGITLPVTQSRSELVVVGSRSHMSPETEAYIATLSDSPQMLSRGSSLKLCMVAEGSADIYPRFAPTMEWDTAAGDAICRAAGCEVLQYPSLEPVVYNKENLLNPWFLVRQKSI